MLADIGERGRIIGIDCSPSMLAKARGRVRRNRWSNVEVLDSEFGIETVGTVRPNAILFSYSLSMIPDWERALDAAYDVLLPGGRIAVVDFVLDRKTAPARLFSHWLSFNHVKADRPYEDVLSSYFQLESYQPRSGALLLWTYFTFIGLRKESQSSSELSAQVMDLYRPVSPHAP
jgi:ubiquinone/menaquinone biosynthesis C-methylase UbiE